MLHFNDTMLAEKKKIYVSDSFEGFFYNPSNSSHVHMQSVSLIYDLSKYLIKLELNSDS